MATRSALLEEIDTLPPRYYGEVINFVSYIKEKKVNKSLSLEKAAEMAVEEYTKNPELPVSALCLYSSLKYFHKELGLCN